MAGIDPEHFTISERHLKVYEHNADPWPTPHKDRATSAVSIELLIVIPELSSACVFPRLQRGPNREERAVFLTCPNNQRSDQIYETQQCVVLREQSGDIIAFLGSKLNHGGGHPAGAAILYINVNGLSSDLLNKNIYCAVEPA